MAAALPSFFVVRPAVRSAYDNRTPGTVERTPSPLNSGAHRLGSTSATEVGIGSLIWARFSVVYTEFASPNEKVRPY